MPWRRKGRRLRTGSTATLRASASFCLSLNSGARTKTFVLPVDRPQSIHTHRHGGASTAPCRTSKSSAKRLNVRKAGPCTLKNPAGFGNRDNEYALSCSASYLDPTDRHLAL